MLFRSSWDKVSSPPCHIHATMLYLQEDSGKTGEFIQQSLSKINFTEDRKAAVKNTDLVIEAIIENLSIKQEVFSEIDNVSTRITICAEHDGFFSIMLLLLACHFVLPSFPDCPKSSDIC